jgi:hypothetical protein
MHSLSESVEDCTFCSINGTMIKQLTNPAYMPDNKISVVGDITKDHIKENKELLEQEKQKARSETYDPT